MIAQKKVKDSGIRVQCPGCDRKFKPSGLANHGRMIHWWNEKAIEAIVKSAEYIHPKQ